MLIAHTPGKLHTELDVLRTRGGTQRCVSLVTTKGHLHDGHGAVINAAKTVSDVVVLAIIPGLEDGENDKIISAGEFQDIGFAERHKADLLYVPHASRTASAGCIGVRVAEFLPEKLRPHGISPEALTTHLRIINTIQPDIMVWGARKYLEYRSVRRMISDLDIRTQLQCIPTVRHANGLAVSSQHTTLDTDDKRLPILYESLKNIAHALRAGASNFEKVENTARVALKGAGFQTDYLSILDDESLQPAGAMTTAFRIVAGATLDSLTIHDNLGFKL